MSKSRPILSKSRLNSWYSNPTTKTILKALVLAFDKEIRDLVLNTGINTEKLDLLVAEKRTKAKLVEDLYIASNLVAIIQDEIIFDDDEKSVEEELNAVRRERKKDD